MDQDNPEISPILEEELGLKPWQPIRMVAIDLDGTLLNDSKQVARKTVDALCCLPDQDVRIVIASARPPRSVRQVYRALKLDTLQINYNGALIWNERQQQVVFHRPLDCAIMREMVEAARRFYKEVIVSCELLDRWYTDRHDPTFTTQTGRMFKPDVVAPFSSFCNMNMTKLMLLGPPPLMIQLEELMLKQFGESAAIIRADDDLIQIMDKRVGKGIALKQVADHYGITMDQVMAIGDAPNDVGMLRMAGIAVAMDNAYPVVKDVADWVAPSNNDHGVHAALQRYGLCF